MDRPCSQLPRRELSVPPAISVNPSVSSPLLTQSVSRYNDLRTEMVFYLLLDWPGDTEYNSSQHDTIINSLRTRTTLVLPTKYNTQRTVLYSVDERDSENTAMHAVSPVSSLQYNQCHYKPSLTKTCSAGNSSHQHREQLYKDLR